METKEVEVTTEMKPVAAVPAAAAGDRMLLVSDNLPEPDCACVPQIAAVVCAAIRRRAAAPPPPALAAASAKKRHWTGGTPGRPGPFILFRSTAASRREPTRELGATLH